MMIPRAGEEYPLAPAGPHGGHEAHIVAVDMHGEPSFDTPKIPPTMLIECSCGARWFDDLIELTQTA